MPAAYHSTAEKAFNIRLFALQKGEDDPKKCSSAKLCRLGLVIPLHNTRHISRSAVVLNPSISEVLSQKDRESLRSGLVIIDCSWKHAEDTFTHRFRGLNRRLPLLLASNPINYSKIGVLSSAEALAAALHITGYEEHARRVLSVFKWGETFWTLNHEPLEEYRAAETPEDMLRIEEEYFGR
jgi:pre-rRNA-processing protein TSR3